MFFGRYDCVLDAKGRLNFPARFREEMGESFVVMEWIGRCLFALPMAEVERLSEKLGADELMDSWEITGDLFSTACEVVPDKQDAPLLVRHDLAGGAEQIAGDLPAVHQLICAQLFRQTLHLCHRQCEQAAADPFHHHEALPHLLPETGGEIQASLGIQHAVVAAKKHLRRPLPACWCGQRPHWSPFYPTELFLL